jgi:hypothetical protein
VLKRVTQTLSPIRPKKKIGEKDELLGSIFKPKLRIKQNSGFLPQPFLINIDYEKKLAIYIAYINIEIDSIINKKY